LSLLLTVVFRSVCRTTHHRLAVDALRHLFLHYYGEYLAGAMAPDERFGDFRNHVVHVEENYWGGAPHEANRWYGRLVDALRRREWAEGVFAAGVLSHYFSDPFMPLHTARSEEDTKVHRAIEWSIRKSYGRLQHIIERDLGGYPQLETPSAADWLPRMVLTGAELAHEHYAAVLQHFDLARALRDPLAGMDQDCQHCIAHCLAHAVVGFARVLERAISEAEVELPAVETTLQGFLVAVAAPFRSIVDQGRDLNERMALEAFFDEAQRIGKVIQNLSVSDREIRRLHAEEVLRLPLHQLDHQPAALTGTLYGSGRDEQYHPNRLMAEAIFPSERPVSAAWREAQRRVQQRRSADGRPALSSRAA
jgi:zinc dependent phospholipase C